MSSFNFMKKKLSLNISVFIFTFGLFCFFKKDIFYFLKNIFFILKNVIKKIENSFYKTVILISNLTYSFIYFENSNS